jgi:hypothetical protein
MFIKEYTEQTRHVRTSKLGKEHSYLRQKAFCVFRCDNCNSEFVRARGNMDPKRISNNYFHVCDNCDAKRFAQKTGITRKQIWDMPASSGLDISKL